MPTDSIDDFAASIARVMGVDGVFGLRRLSGGASRETWRFSADGEDFVLQRVRNGTPGGLRCEPAVLRAAHVAGVPVPELVVDGSASSELDRPFMIVRAVEGETIARKILRDDDFSVARTRLVADLGAAAATLHKVSGSGIQGLVEEDQIDRYRSVLDMLGEPHPVFEVAFRWLVANMPPSERTCLVHGDFRLGNVMVNHNGLAAILDWELAHLGDPMEDLGWLCVRAWRFGGLKPVAGLGDYAELVDAYSNVAGTRPDVDVVKWWETLGTLKWGIMCITQANAHLSGAARSHELAAIGRRVCENEYDLIELLSGRAP